jgi:hypothetical protein
MLLMSILFTWMAEEETLIDCLVDRLMGFHGRRSQQLLLRAR